MVVLEIILKKYKIRELLYLEHVHSRREELLMSNGKCHRSKRTEKYSVVVV